MSIQQWAYPRHRFRVRQPSCSGPFKGEQNPLRSLYRGQLVSRILLFTYIRFRLALLDHTSKTIGIF